MKRFLQYSIFTYLLLTSNLLFGQFLDPVITSINPASGVPGTQVRILGINFGQDQFEQLDVYLGNTKVTSFFGSQLSNALDITIPTGIYGPLDLKLQKVEIFSDGFVDVKQTSNLVTFTVLHTDPSSNFSVQNIITDLADGAIDVKTADIDDDGDLDVISSSWIDNLISVYKNTDGQGSFGPRIVMGAGRRAYPADLDDDGDIDIVSTNNDGNIVRWYDNFDGTGSFLTNTVTTTVNWPEEAYPADLDNDGDLDLVVSSSFDNKLAWYENLNNQQGVGFTSWSTQKIINSSASGALRGIAADLDNDGDQDILSSTGNDFLVRSYTNNGGIFGTGVQQISGFEDIVGLHVSDLNGDGLLDIIGSSGLGIIIRLNLGSGTFGTPQTISTTGKVWDIDAADIDNDGDVDILSAGPGNVVGWYENNDGLGSFSTTQTVISTAVSDVRNVRFSDLDGDGDLDVLSASTLDKKVAWYRNLSSGKNITAFSVPGQFLNTVINNVAKTVSLEVLDTTNLTNIIPSFTISQSAQAFIGASPTSSGVEIQDFTNPVEYTIVAEDGSSQIWTVSVVPVNISFSQSQVTVNIAQGDTLSLSNIFNYTSTKSNDITSNAYVGLPVNFSKSDFADHTLAANQDQVTSQVWLTRASSQGLFNINQESSYLSTSPSLTLWSSSPASQTSTYTQTWVQANGSNPPGMVGNTYSFLTQETSPRKFDIKWNSWTQVSGGGFSYERREVPSFVKILNSSGPVFDQFPVNLEIYTANLAEGTYEFDLVANVGQVTSTKKITVVVETGGQEIAYYPLNGNTLDFSSNNLHGTANGAVTTTDRFGNPNAAYLFDGINDYINVPDNDLLDFGTSDFTLSAWVKTSNSTSLQRIISKGSFAGSTGYMLRTTPLGKAFFEINGIALVTSNAVIADGEWHMVSVVLDRDNSAKIFIDGVLDNATLINTTSNDVSNTTPLTFGIHGTSSEPLDGSLDEVHLFNYALTDNEVLDIHIAEIGLQHWFLEDADPNDVVGGLTATLNGVITPTPDRFGNSNAAFFLDGASNYSYSGNTAVGGSSQFSISAWFYPNFQNGFGTILSENNIGGQGVFYIDVNQDNIGFVTYVDGTSTNQLFTTDAAVKPFAWNHVAVTFDNGNATIFLNGEENVSAVLASPVFDGTSDLSIGSGTFFNGNLDDIRIYDYPLNSEDISQLYFQNGWTGVSTANLVASYPFNGNPDDESGNGYNGIPLNGPVITADRFGILNSAYLFDGFDDHIRIDHSGGINLTGDVTINAWIKPSEFTDPGDFWSIIFNDDALNEINISTTGSLVYHYFDGTGYPLQETEPYGVPLNVWSMVTVTIDASNNLSMFINGVRRFSGLINRVSESSPFVSSIGGDYQQLPNDGNDRRWFDGNIDDVSIYNIVLSDNDIISLYGVGGWTGPNDLIAHWPITNFDGFNDVSGFGNNLDPEGTSIPFATIDRFRQGLEAMDLDGTVDLTTHAVARNTNHPQGNASFSYSFWEFHTSDIIRSVFDIQDGQFGIGIDPTNGIVEVESSLFGQIFSDNIKSAASKNRWNHIAVVKEDSELSIYVNGILTITGQGFNTDIQSGDIFIGNNAFLNDPFTGKLDDIRIYNYAIDETEVLNLFNERVDTNVQIAWVEPSLSTPEDEVTLYYNAERGNKALMGADRVYVHLGAVIGADPIYEWGNYVLDTTWFSGTKDNGIGEMFDAGGNTWGYTLSPSARDALGVPGTDLMQRLGMIFRSPDAALIGQGTPSEYGDFPGGRVEDGTYWTPGDIYVDLVNLTPRELDSLALVDLYNSTNGTGWFNNTGWLSGSIDTWYGVTVDPVAGRVIAIDLDGNNLTGTLPTSLSALTACEYFSISTNSVGGAIPSEIGSMTALLDIYLDTNNFTGEIPSEIGDIPNLQSFEVYTNGLTGTIPTSFGNLSGTLLFLDVENNQLSGSIPTFLSSMTNLQTLWLSENNFSGVIPAGLGNLVNLQELYLYGNSLTGEIPSEIGNLINLRYLELDNNQLNGEIPASFVNLNQLTNLDLSNNQLSGAIPDGFSSFTSLVYVDISYNLFNSIPDLSGNSGLNELYIEENKFSMEDILLNLNVPLAVYSYIPQKLHGNQETRFAAAGEDYFFDLGFDQNVILSSYTWYRNGLEYTSSSLPFLFFTPISTFEAGTWYVEITNSSLPGLVLTTENITLNVIDLCTSKATDPSDTRIDRFVFGDLDNTSDPASCATYTNFTNLTATIYPGQTVDFGFSLGTCGIETNKAFALFIDFDGSGDFSTLERVGESEVISGTGFISLAVPIDASAPLGTFLMRVVAVETNDPSTISGCVEYAKGETEDYTVNIVESAFDLEVTADDIQPLTYFNSKTPATSGIDVLNISATVSNSEIGNVTNLSGGLELFLSTDQFFDASDISAGSVDVNVSGGGSEVFTDLSFTIPGAATTGSYYLILAVDPNDVIGETNENNNTAISSNPIYVLTGDNSPPAVSLQNPPSSYEIGTGGVSVTASITDDSGIQNVFLAYGRISDITDDSDLLQYNVIIPEEISTGVFQHTLSDSDFDDVGVQYFFGATDNAGNFNNSLPLPATISTEFPVGSIQLTDPRPVANTENPQDTDYRIFSVPVRGATIQSVLGFSSTDRKQWRVWQYSNGNSELSSTGSSLEAGKGYWLIYKNTAGIDLNFGGVAVDASNTNPFIMNLSIGYNLIGNPYKFPISWQQVIDHNIGKGIINDVNVSGLTFFREGFENQGNGTLGVTEGAFVLSNLTIGLEIPFSAQTARLGNNLRTFKNSLDDETWEVGINLANDKTFYNVASVGMNPQAENGMDDHDHPAVPYLFNYLEFNSGNELLENRISRDIVKTTTDHVWEFEATTSYDPSDAVLSWDNSYFGDNDRQLYLYDGSEERIINMREQREYHFFLNGKRNFRILYGSAEFIKSELQPERMTLGHAYPNPFADVTRIPFSLSDESDTYKVRMTIYNSVGELVNVLADDEFSSGFYAVDWEGTNTLGQKVSEGIYIYKLTITDVKGSKDLTGKLIYGK